MEKLLNRSSYRDCSFAFYNIDGLHIFFGRDGVLERNVGVGNGVVEPRHFAVFFPSAALFTSFRAKSATFSIDIGALNTAVPYRRRFDYIKGLAVHDMVADIQTDMTVKVG